MVTATKRAKYLRFVLCKLGFKETESNPIYKDNKPTIDIVALHIDIQFFAIQDGIHKTKDVTLLHIPGVINPSDDLTKSLDRVLHERHARYIMGHYNVI